jgi:hypothetical protein
MQTAARYKEEAAVQNRQNPNKSNTKQAAHGHTHKHTQGSDHHYHKEHFNLCTHLRHRPVYTWNEHPVGGESEIASESSLGPLGVFPLACVKN